MKKNDIYLTWLKETENETIGFLTVYNEKLHQFFALTLPWKDNQKNISRIPCGTYNYIKWYSPTFKMTVIRILNVPNRSNILIHPANYHTELRGCIALGKNLSDINGDGETDVANSRKAVRELIEILPEEKGTIYINKAYK